MTPKHFIGIDISKLTLDIAVTRQRRQIFSGKIENSVKAIKGLLQQLKQEHQVTRANALFCAEHMGIYATFLQEVTVKKKITLCMESPLHLKRSLGIIRGKDDKIDALRIARYAEKNHHSLRLWQPPRAIIQDLKTLASLRKRLLKTKILVAGNSRNEQYYLSAAARKKLYSYSNATRLAIKEDIERIEQEMDEMIRDDPRLLHLMDLVTSVPRIGPVIGRQLIIATNEFEEHWTAKKFASYCGVAPFDYSSGTSVRGKARVSSIANKEIKSLLHISAMGFAKKGDSFLTLYYQRKVKEGKNGMSVMNAIRNKLIHRVFSCVRNNQYYTEKK